MIKYYLENRGGEVGGSEHSKFYEIIENSSGFRVTWGKTTQRNTSSAQTIEHPYSNKEDRHKNLLKILKAKIKKGYVIVSSSGTERIQLAPAKKSGRASGSLSQEGRRFGVEIETHDNFEIRNVVSELRESGLETNLNLSYFKSNGLKWDIKRDSSCGYEIASPILSGEAGIFDAKTTVDKIQKICRNPVNSRCGLHVTIDIRDFSKKEVIKLIIAYLKAQELFYDKCNDSRQNNSYAVRNKAENIGRLLAYQNKPNSLPEVISIAGGDKYRGLNLKKILDLKVVEFRMMESTINPLKLGRWIRQCVEFVSGVKASSKTFVTDKPFTPKTFLKLLKKEW